ncbi:MAG: hypothetical protein AAF539_08180 [Planctomycetota bacterium]
MTITHLHAIELSTALLISAAVLGVVAIITIGMAMWRGWASRGQSVRVAGLTEDDRPIDPAWHEQSYPYDCHVVYPEGYDTLVASLDLVSGDQYVINLLQPGGHFNTEDHIQIPVNTRGQAQAIFRALRNGRIWKLHKPKGN